MKKLIIIMTIDSVVDEMHKFFEKNTQMYFEIPKGKGKYKYYHRMDSHTWPGNVASFMIPMDEESIEKFKEDFIKYMKSITTEHYWSYLVVPVEDFEMFEGGMTV